MGIIDHIKEKWRELDKNLTGKQEHFLITASSISKKKNILEAFRLYARGKTLDAGAGNMMYKPYILEHAKEYKSLDFEQTESKYRKTGKLDYVGDIENMPIASENFDTVFCSQVLEHVPHPQKAFAEVIRVLKKGGHAIFTVPHLAYIHNAPHDFQRFTRYGLLQMARENNAQTVLIKELGGLFAFLGYIRATFFLGLTYGIPILWQVILYLGIPVNFLELWLDKITGNQKIFALNYIIVVKK